MDAPFVPTRLRIVTRDHPPPIPRNLQNTYRRAINYHSSRGSSCSKCRGWGGIHIPYMEWKPHERQWYCRWMRKPCDACTGGLGMARQWPAATDMEIDVEVREVIHVEAPLPAISMPEHTQKTCDVCGDEKSEGAFPVLITLTCAHESTTCSECVQGWIAAQLDQGNCAITCPHMDCGQQLEAEDLQRTTMADEYQRYLDIILKQSLANDITFKYCLNSHCSSGQYIAETDRFFSCDACQSVFCLRHEPMANHGAETCEQYDTRMTELKRKREEEVRVEEASQAEMKRIATQCPDCGVHIQKIAGCDHMTCGRCKFEFCFLCGADYHKIRANGNDEHKRSCRYHSTNLDPEYDWVRPQAQRARRRARGGGRRARGRRTVQRPA